MQSLKELYKIGHGPSSSHTIGPENACLYILEKYPKATSFTVTLFGSLAFTGKGHLTDFIIKETLKNVEIIFDYKTEKDHPNTMNFKVFENEIKVGDIDIVSVGGGDIKIDKEKVYEDIYPFKNFEEIKEWCKDNNKSLADVVYTYENKDIKDYLNNVFDIMIHSIEDGLNKTGELPGSLHVLRKAKTLYNNVENKDKKLKLVSAYAFAVSEQNASGGLIVTAPTCGASGVLPSVLYFMYKDKNISKEKIIDALAVAGIIGDVIKTNASISGALAGCQSEVGSACSMAAAALSFVFDESIEEIEYSAEIALEHHLGLTCDPINGLVQIPCIERNAVAALRAMDSSSLASILNGTRKISFDTVVKTMFETGKDLNQNYRETSKGGLAKNYKTM